MTELANELDERSRREGKVEHVTESFFLQKKQHKVGKFAREKNGIQFCPVR